MLRAIAVLLAGLAIPVLVGAPAAADDRASERPAAASVGAGEHPRVNRLARESSPYLRQHAQNPVDWYPWGAEALGRARAENKLIFLSIGYSTCYWCHVMERTVFADPGAAERLNADFIAILVDREERPDLDQIYMTVRQQATGRGGWPLSVLLTPDLEPLWAGGYLPIAQFNNLLGQARDGWNRDPVRLLRHARRLAGEVRRSGRLTGDLASHDLPDRDLIRRATERFAARYDRQHGGFGTSPKFPQPAVLEMLMAVYERDRDGGVLDMVVETLGAMARGGIQDHLGGGFHRYTTDRGWRIPHFEKMLYDNAELLHAYARAYHLTGNETFRRVADRIVTFVAREMTSPSGMFYSALDSETENQEGRYYAWSRTELQQRLGPEDLAILRRNFGFAPLPGSAGLMILYRMADVPAAADRLERLRRTLLTARETRHQPFRDDKVIALWNGLMIEALAYGGQVLHRRDYVRRAERAAAALLGTLIDENGDLMRVAHSEVAGIGAYLADYGGVILALSELYRATGNGRWLGRAAGLADRMRTRFEDTDSGGYFDVAGDVGDLIVRPKAARDGALPAANSLAARALHGLAALGLPRFAADARGILSAFTPTLTLRPDALPYMLWAAAEFHRDAVALPGTGAPPAESADVVRPAAWTIADGVADRRLQVVLDIDAGWHVNANPASLDFLIPTTITAASGGEPIDLIPDYPPGRPLETPLGAIAVYDRATEIGAPLPAAGPTGDIELGVRVQACNDDGVCLLPNTIDLTLAY